ncbi:MAG TPA: LuxR family transcriptional regulator [Candidatus Limnocylindrales bacterium]|nr:LuxR family transcriptional regulator [Candidatus Limnocylindrales bacterium]
MTRRRVSPILIGRSAELAALRAAVDGREGDTRPVVVLRGDAGAGKSRLIDELRRSLDGGDGHGRTVFALGHCVPGADGALPCAAVLELLDDLGRAAREPSTQESVDAARRLFVEVRDASTGAVGPAADGGGNPIRRLEAVLGAVHTVAPHGRAVLVVDDLQWADAGTIDLVAYLARRLARSRTVLLLAYREREARLRPEVARCLADVETGWAREWVQVQPLGHPEAVELVHAIAAPMADERALHIAERAGGNPLFLEQLATAESEAVHEAEAEERDAASAPDGTQAGADPWHLSDREREVLALVGAGRTNREIGDALFITSKTASSHVTHILDKLGVDSRVEAALAAAAAGLVPAQQADGESGPYHASFQGSPDAEPERRR